MVEHAAGAGGQEADAVPVVRRRLAGAAVPVRVPPNCIVLERGEDDGIGGIGAGDERAVHPQGAEVVVELDHRTRRQRQSGALVDGEISRDQEGEAVVAVPGHIAADVACHDKAVDLVAAGRVAAEGDRLVVVAQWRPCRQAHVVQEGVACQAGGQGVVETDACLTAVGDGAIGQRDVRRRHVHAFVPVPAAVADDGMVKYAAGARGKETKTIPVVRRRLAGPTVAIRIASGGIILE